MMDDSSPPGPAVSVIIPTKNRREMLAQTIASILRQTVPLELLVMDDGSTDGTTDFIRAQFPAADFPQVKVRRGETSMGPTVRRNEGASLASAPFLFTIDDDCLVPSPVTFEQTIAAFDSPRIGAVTIPFINVKQDKRVRFAAPDRDGRYVSFMFFGGMVAFRREAYAAVNGYRTYYFMHVEEPDLSIRLFDRGYVLRLGWADPIEHLESPVRNRKRLHALGPRNFALYEWYNAPLLQLLLRLPLVTAQTFIHTIKIGYPHLGVWGLMRGYGGMAHEWRKRRPVSRSIYTLCRQLRHGPIRLEELESRLPPLDRGSPAQNGNDK